MEVKVNPLIKSSHENEFFETVCQKLSSEEARKIGTATAAAEATRAANEGQDPAYSVEEAVAEVVFLLLRTQWLEMAEMVLLF